MRGTPQDTARLLRWWQGKLQRDCVVDIPRGLFTDQKWMDLVPGLCDAPCTWNATRAGTWRTGTWRTAGSESDASGFKVNGQPLFFFHFSGYDPAAASISKHQDRFTLAACTPATQQLFALYTERLVAAAKERYAAMPYAFARLADGTPLPDCARRAVRRHLDWSHPRPPLRSAAGAQFVIDFLTAAGGRSAAGPSRAWHFSSTARADLQAAFPDVLGSRREAYLNWFRRTRRSGSRRCRPAGTGQTACRAAPAPAAAPAMAAAAAPAVAPLPAAVEAPAPVLPYRMVYRLAWRARHLLRPLTSLAFRQRMRELPCCDAPSRARHGRSTADRCRRRLQRAAPVAHPPGVTVIGYVRAESGVGESARATLRALACTTLPHAVHDFRDGNVSRMGENVDAALDTGARHAISLFHINADQIPHARASLGDRWFGVPYRIGFWAWELEHFPAEWQAAFDHVDEVWVPSTFCQRAVAERSPVPVLCVPHAVAVPDAAAARPRALRPAPTAWSSWPWPT
jgi:hypothetical protein